MAPAVGLVEETIAPDEAALTAEFIEFLKAASAARAKKEGGPVRRFNQGRQTACVQAEFIVLDDLPASYRVGLFASPGTSQARIRFANATSSSDREKDTRGMAISLAGVLAPNLTPGETRQDFILNSHPVMVAPDAREFLALLRANEAGGVKRILYFASHVKAARIGFASRQNHSSHLDIPYWSTTPYAFGADRAVKYIARPCSDRPSPMPKQLTDTYLRETLKAQLERADACFDFMVQFHADEKRTPIEDASVEWEREVSPYHPVARIRIPRQTIDEAGASACDDAAFNPWHSLPEHRPLGSMNRARREIYRAMSEFRRKG